MIVARTAEELAAVPHHGTRVVVMTMGALHDGHLALVRRAQELGDQVVVTIFVNPLQFNEAADYERYPRTLEADCALLESLGVDAVFAPGDEVMYPAGVPVVSVSAGVIGTVLEGAARPGHFDGVVTVVAKLLNLTQPQVAVFGAKDAQQVIAVRALVRDLNFPVAIATASTVRDPDGLAQSSRNVFLSPSERESALALSRSLQEADAAAQAGRSLADVVAAGREVLSRAAGVEVDYFSALNPADASEVQGDYRGEVVIAVAAHVGATRLIDNVTTRIGPPEGAVGAEGELQ
ncbi:pantoate--beta-alanine ligase [Demequina sp. B12]|uniref:pantoate--beta-alanine ligase n=1 Tax=Demequina sp. B12 TaxID=2992757 RepID=UPI00237A43D1|nr:pantoate--beta-alanine ligase [Demequina sp. B12]MDE0573678.1 pantoate--beta-alanine ligase [Demequina sp. B12]